jgi:hypothetical protein
MLLGKRKEYDTMTAGQREPMRVDGRLERDDMR